MSKRIPTLAPPSRRAYSIEEAAEVVGVSAAHLYRLALRGELRAVRSGRRWLVPVASIDELLGVEPTATAAR
ncbi:MAG: helix-turn-helix domain-containing protein [Candidatus Dormiibacterota bacterium]|jgi:excisionase family DNA binding protein